MVLLTSDAIICSITVSGCVIEKYLSIEDAISGGSFYCHNWHHLKS